MTAPRDRNLDVFRVVKVSSVPGNREFVAADAIIVGFALFRSVRTLRHSRWTTALPFGFLNAVSGSLPC
jgi:hypothetical protein